MVTRTFNLYKLRKLRIYSDVACSDFINVLAILSRAFVRTVYLRIKYPCTLFMKFNYIHIDYNN